MFANGLLSFSNLPDDIWARLKTWAKTQAASSAELSLDECKSYAQLVCRELTGRPNALRPDVVAFYAKEALEMIAVYRASSSAVGRRRLNV